MIMAQHPVLDFPFLAGFLGVAISLLLGVFYRIRRRDTLNFTRNIPLAGLENESGLFAQWKARLTFFKNGPKLIHAAYEKVYLHCCVFNRTYDKIGYTTKSG